MKQYPTELVVKVLKEFTTRKERKETVMAIANRYGIPFVTVRHWAKKAGLIESHKRYDWGEIKTSLTE